MLAALPKRGSRATNCSWHCSCLQPFCSVSFSFWTFGLEATRCSNDEDCCHRRGLTHHCRDGASPCHQLNRCPSSLPKHPDHRRHSSPIIPTFRPVANKTDLNSGRPALHSESPNCPHRSTTSSSSHVHRQDTLVAFFQEEPIKLGLDTTWVTKCFFRPPMPTRKPLSKMTMLG